VTQLKRLNPKRLTIQSRSNPRVKELFKQKNRYYFFEGEKLINDVLSRSVDIEILLVNETCIDFLKGLAVESVGEVWVVSETVLAKLSSLKTPPDYIAVVDWKPEPVNFRESRVIIALNNIQDPGNLGSIFRCAGAFGVDALILCGSGVNLNNPKFLRAAQDSFFSVRHHRYSDLNDFIEEARGSNPHLNIYLTSSHFPGKTVPPSEIQCPCIVVMGSEGQGLPQELFRQFSSVSIPQTDAVESLNVGVSACIIMYELFAG
jgi:RNA methyltransferase, TrmH family